MRVNIAGMNKAWEQSGNFERIFNSVASLNREVTYQNTSPDAVIKKFELSGYIDGGFQVVVTVPNEDIFDRLERSTREAGFPEQNFYDRMGGNLRFNNENRGVIAAFIQAVSQAEPLFSEIEGKVSANLGIDLSREYDVSRLISLRTNTFTGNLFAAVQQRQSVFATTSAHRMFVPRQELAKNPNAERLEEAGFTEDIPKEFICPLSCDVMYDPVMVRNNENHKFERTWILRALETRQENPLNRQPLNARDLVSDSYTKERIAAFVNAYVYEVLHESCKPVVSSVTAKKKHCFFSAM